MRCSPTKSCGWQRTATASKSRARASSRCASKRAPTGQTPCARFPSAPSRPRPAKSCNPPPLCLEMPVIEPPRPDEEPWLVALSEATGFFHLDEVEIVREMFQSYASDPDSDEYTWIVYREHAGGPALGFACYGPASLARGTYDLYWIVVDRQHQSKKIGSALLEHVEAD